MDVANIRRLFPVTERFAYLNHAAVGAPPQPVVKAMTSYLAQRTQAGSEPLAEWDDRIETMRQTLAGFVGAHRDEISFTGSVSHGLNIVAAGLDWSPGDNLICAETEFPANVYPWTNLGRLGVEVRFVPARQNRVPVDELADLIDARTRLAAISFVEFCTGYRNDLKALASLCHDRGVLLCVDGIQGLGALAFSVAETPVDFLATQADKWRLGPSGAGFLFVRRELLSKLEPVMTGWRSVVDRDDYFRFDSPLRASAERFEPGSPNYVGLLGMDAAVRLLLDVGLEEIEARIMALTDLLIDGLQRKACTITSPIKHRRERSGIVCFRHPSLPTGELAQRLQAASVIVSVRGDVIRVSPHFYNSADDIHQLLDTLPTNT